tara:strand:+ start:102 stop:458 length:357 start_codon:yes stop_codon:yes gene_type:complete
MSVIRIVADLAADEPRVHARFYQDLLGLEVAMDQGFIVTVQSASQMQPQLSFMNQGGSNAPVPALSIEVDNLDNVYAKARQLKAEIVYPLTEEPWNVRRFFLRDPAGRLINILEHRDI